MGPVAWKAAFDAGPAEVADLLYFSHDSSSAIGASLLAGESRTIGFDATGITWEGMHLRIVFADGEERPQPLVAVNSEGGIVGRVQASEHRHLAILFDAGVELVATAGRTGDEGTVIELEVKAQLD